MRDIALWATEKNGCAKFAWRGNEFGGLLPIGFDDRERRFNLRKLFMRQMPARAAGSLTDLFRPFRAAERGRDARLFDGPPNDQLGDGVPGRPCDFLKAIDQVVIPLPLFTLKNRILVTTIVFPKNLISADFSGKQAFHQRPIDQNGDAAFAAPRQRVGLDLPQKHVVGRLERSKRALGDELFELRKRQV